MRNRIILKLFIGLFIVFIVSGCDPESDNKIYLNENDNGRTIEISKNDTLIITLESNPTTGYRWNFANLDGNFLFQDGDSIYTQDPECGAMDGCGGTEQMTFQTNQTGNGAIRLEYKRGNETTPDAREFNITIIVK